MQDAPEPHSLPARMARSAGTLWWLKGLGTTAFMWGFFALYFALLHHPAYPVAVMPLTAVDRAVPFVPQLLWAYLSLWVYVCLPPTLMRGFGRLLRYALANALMCAIGLAIFWRWPTAVAPMTDAASNAPGFAMLRGVDASGNAFPSLHVAAATFAGWWLDRLLREHGAGPLLRTLAALWGAAIVVSTVAVRQHVSWDVAGGLVLAGLVLAATAPWLGPCPGEAAWREAGIGQEARARPGLRV